MPFHLNEKMKSFFARIYKPWTTPFIKYYRSVVNGMSVNHRTSMQVAAYYRAKVYLSSTIAKLPIDFKDKKNRVLDNRASYLLNTSPNPEMTAFNFKLTMVATAQDKGNFFAEIERNVLGDPIYLWPIPSEDVEAYRDPQNNGKLWWRVTGMSGGQNGVLVDPMNMFHIPSLHMEDGIVGQSLIAYAQNVLGISLGSDQFSNGLFANGGLPSGAISLKGKLTEESYTRLKETWAAGHTGKKVGSTVFLEDEAKYESISHDPESLQYIETKEFNVEEIARFWGVPPSKLFLSKSAKYSNQEQSNLEVVTDTVSAWTARIEAEANMKLIRIKGQKCEFNLFQISKGDMDTRAKYYTARMQTASLTPNQIRELEGEEGYEGGDRYYIASNNFTPIDRQDDLIDAKIKPKEVAAPAEESEDEKSAKALLNQLNSTALTVLQKV